MRVVSILAALLVVVGLAGCGGGGGPSDLSLPSTPPPTVATTLPASIGSPPTSAPSSSASSSTASTTLPAYVSFVATSHVAQLPVFATPTAARPARELALPQALLVDTRRAGGWVQVFLPVLPAGTTGWVRDSDVTIGQTVYRVTVLLGPQTLTVSRRDEVIYAGPLVVSGAAASTPPGRYYLHTVVGATSSHTTDSPYAYALIPRLVALLPLGTPFDVSG